jgi:hypothetical protein
MKQYYVLHRRSRRVKKAFREINRAIKFLASLSKGKCLLKALEAYCLVCIERNNCRDWYSENEIVWKGKEIDLKEVRL